VGQAHAINIQPAVDDKMGRQMSDYDKAFAAATGAIVEGNSADPYDAIMKSITPPPAQEVAATAGKSINQTLNSIPRQLGLTARYALEGPAQAAQIVTEPIRQLITDPLSRLFGGAGGQPLGQAVSSLADKIGLPKPEGANERVIGDATKLMAGTGGMAGVANLASALPAMTGKVFSGLAANPAQQIGSAAGAGLLGGASREGGGGAMEQAGAGLLGSVVGGLAPGAISGAVNAGKRLMTPAMTPQQMDIKLTSILGSAGTDYSKLPQQVRGQLRTELARSLQSGKELDPIAVARLADFKTVGATPTRGMVSQNPVQITREMNLAKTAANSADEQLHGLPLIQNQNNATLIRNLNDAGATAGDPFKAGMGVIDGIAGKDAALERGVSALYQQARDTSGRSANLDGAAFTRQANQALDEALLGGALPSDVANHMNRIAKGEVPFNVDYAEQLKTRIAALQRGTSDGSARMALSKVRQALDDTPLLNANPVNPGGLPAVPGTVPPSPSILGQDSINAFNEARNAARQRFGWQESAKPIEAALGGAEPDKFIQKFVIGGTVADAKSIADTAPAAGVKEAILAHLKDKSLNGAADEVGKFSQSAYNRALNQIGDRKLELFFNPEELAHLKAVGRVSSYMQNQPVGSAVNNSNSGAMLLGRGMDMLNGVAGKLPFGRAAVIDPLRSINISLQQRQAQNFMPGLLAEQPKAPFSQGLLLPGIAIGGGLLSP
jgi:hypothetical protein